jgi:hypothetical protein
MEAPSVLGQHSPPAVHGPARPDRTVRTTRSVNGEQQPGPPFKLIEAAQHRWRAVNAPHLVALVRADVVFVNGKLVERPDLAVRLRHLATGPGPATHR